MKKYYHVITEKNDEYISIVAHAESVEAVKAYFAGQNIKEIIALCAAQAATLKNAPCTSYVEIDPEPVKCADLFTASFADGTLMTGTLEQIYAAQNNRKMAIKPAVWLWCSDSGLYMVDYILEGAGWTLGVFDTLSDAETARNVFDTQPAADIARMLHAEAVKCFSCPMHLEALGSDGKRYPAEYDPKYKTIFFAIPAKVNVLGYIPTEEG